MGLDTSHDCWHGAYSAFMRWRETLARVAGLPPLRLMEGFYEPLPPRKLLGGLPTLYHGFDERNYLSDIDSQLPIRWSCLRPSPLFVLLYHSDCEGEIAWQDCGPLAEALEALLPKLPNGDDLGHIGNWRDKTSQFVKGLRAAFAARENVNFH